MKILGIKRRSFRRNNRPGSWSIMSLFRSLNRALLIEPKILYTNKLFGAVCNSTKHHTIMAIFDRGGTGILIVRYAPFIMHSHGLLMPGLPMCQHHRDTQPSTHPSTSTQYNKMPRISDKRKMVPAEPQSWGGREANRRSWRFLNGGTTQFSCLKTCRDC